MKDKENETDETGKGSAPDGEDNTITEEVPVDVLEVRNTTIRKDLGEDHVSFDDPAFGGIRHFMRHGSNYKEVTEPRLELNHSETLREYEVEDTASLIAFLKKHGKAEDGIIFHTGFKVMAYLNEAARDEVATFSFVRSLEYNSILGPNGAKTFKQKELAKIIEAFPEVFRDHGNLLPMITKVKFDVNTTFESDIDPDNLKYYYEEKNGMQEGSIPKRLKLHSPYFEGSDNVMELDIDLDIHKPSQDNADLTFTLSNFKQLRTERDAIADEVDKLKDELHGWLFVAGKLIKTVQTETRAVERE